MLGEKFTLDIRPTFVDELDRAAAYSNCICAIRKRQTSWSLMFTKR